jgi:hypothetical protein
LESSPFDKKPAGILPHNVGDLNLAEGRGIGYKLPIGTTRVGKRHRQELGEEMDERRSKFFSLYGFALGLVFLAVNLQSCGPHFGQTVISKPDEFRHCYEAKEKYILRAIANVLKEKQMGTDVKIDEVKQTVETDYLVSGDWRTKSIARVKKLSWREREVTLSIVTEKKTSSGWEMRQLLDEEKYVKIFDTIDLKIYEEMYKME